MKLIKQLNRNIAFSGIYNKNKTLPVKYASIVSRILRRLHTCSLSSFVLFYLFQTQIDEREVFTRVVPLQRLRVAF
jgi:hypothetical protein